MPCANASRLAAATNSRSRLMFGAILIKASENKAINALPASVDTHRLRVLCSIAKTPPWPNYAPHFLREIRSIRWRNVMVTRRRQSLIRFAFSDIERSGNMIGQQDPEGGLSSIH